jgi:hypothetical protein
MSIFSDYAQLFVDAYSLDLYRNPNTRIYAQTFAPLTPPDLASFLNSPRGGNAPEFFLPELTASNPLPIVFGRCRIKPHYIWAPGDAPTYIGRGNDNLFFSWTINVPWSRQREGNR